MSKARRIEVLVDRPLAGRIAEAADRAGVSNYAVLPTLAGRGAHGTWRADELTGATDRVLFTTVLSADKAEALLAALAPLLDAYDLLLTLEEVEVVRGARF